MNQHIFILENELKRKTNMLNDIKQKNESQVITVDPTEVLLEINNEKIVLKLELEQKKAAIKELNIKLLNINKDISVFI